MQIYHSASGGRRPLSGFCPWTPLGDFRSPDLLVCPGFSWVTPGNPTYARVSTTRLNHPPYEILTMTAECWLLEESGNKLMILNFKDKFLPQSATPLMLHLTTAAVSAH